MKRVKTKLHFPTQKSKTHQALFYKKVLENTSSPLATLLETESLLELAKTSKMQANKLQKKRH